MGRLSPIAKRSTLKPWAVIAVFYGLIGAAIVLSLALGYLAGFLAESQ